MNPDKNLQFTLNHFVIAIDGYSSCGKSTLAKALSKKLSLRYVDSGAMYRAVTLYFIEKNIPIPRNGDASGYDYVSVMNHIHITFKYHPETSSSEIYLNNVPVEKQIRLMNVSENVSHVSTLKIVRNHLVALQQQMGEAGGLVMDGRDIGTTVFPQADVKIFMTADAQVRAQRRFDELISKGINNSFEEIFKNLKERDYEDSNRKESPLRKADDAIVLDNSHLNQEEQVEFVLEIINEKFNVLPI